MSAIRETRNKRERTSGPRRFRRAGEAYDGRALRFISTKNHALMLREFQRKNRRTFLDTCDTFSRFELRHRAKLPRGAKRPVRRTSPPFGDRSRVVIN